MLGALSALCREVLRLPNSCSALRRGSVPGPIRTPPSGSPGRFSRSAPLTSREDFGKLGKERLQPDIGARIDGDWVKTLQDMRAHMEGPFWVIADRWGGFFGSLRNLLGVENLCMTFYTDPVFIEEMMDTISDYVIAMSHAVEQLFVSLGEPDDLPGPDIVGRISSSAMDRERT